MPLLPPPTYADTNVAMLLSLAADYATPPLRHHHTLFLRLRRFFILRFASDYYVTLIVSLRFATLPSLYCRTDIIFRASFSLSRRAIDMAQPPYMRILTVTLISWLMRYCCYASILALRHILIYAADYADAPTLLLIFRHYH